MYVQTREELGAKLRRRPNELMTFEKSLRSVFLAALIGATSDHAFGTLPPPPPPLTIKDMIAMSDVVYVGQVAKVIWKELETATKPGRPTDVVLGDVRLETEVIDLLLGDSRRLPKRLVYLVGRSPLLEQQARKQYEGKTFIFMGKVERLSVQSEPSIQIAFPPSGAEPLDTSRLKEVTEEIGRKQGFYGPRASAAGTNEVAEVIYQLTGLGTPTRTVSLSRGKARIKVVSEADGKRFSKESQFRTQEFDAIARKVLETGFFELPESFTSDSIDGTYAVITVVTAGVERRKAVTVMAGSKPPAALEQLLDSLWRAARRLDPEHFR